VTKPFENLLQWLEVGKGMIRRGAHSCCKDLFDADVFDGACRKDKPPMHCWASQGKPAVAAARPE
jgi:hypothetical protein